VEHLQQREISASYGISLSAPSHRGRQGRWATWSNTFPNLAGNGAGADLTDYLFGIASTPPGSVPRPRTRSSASARTGAFGMDAGDVPRPLPALGRNAAIPTVARTGRLAYSRQILQSNIWRQEIPASAGAILQPARLTASSAVEYNAQYSPDGGRIAFSSTRSGSREIWTCASDGAQCVQVTTFNGFTGTPGWSPDGRQIVFDCTAAGQLDVYVVDANGGSPRRLTDATHGKIPSWSHDGRWIYFSSTVTGRNEIWKIPSAGGKAVQVTRNGGFIAFEAPDRRALFYLKTDQSVKLWRSAIDGSGETAVLDGVDSRGFVVTADRVYYLRQEPNSSFTIRRYVIATREDSQVASLAKPVFRGLSISPDGKYLIYSQRLEASNLMLVEDFH
jgi:dipeptidyl aminopeptidase/acylaminoacyl peptidase